MREGKVDLSHVLLVLLISGLASAQVPERLSPEQSHYQCAVTNIPTSWAFDDAPGSIERSNAQFAESGEGSLDLRFRSRQSAQINALALVVEYLDTEGQVLVRVPMFARVNPAVAKIPSNVFRPADSWGEPLSSGDEALLVGDSVGIRIGRCPARARVTFANLQLSDDTTRTYSSRDWTLGPTPVIVPRLPDALPEFPVQPPVSLLAKLQISASGTVLDVLAEEPADPRVVGWIRDRMMQDWKFHPAILNGNATDSEIKVLFLIHAKGMPSFVEKKPVLQPVTLIRFAWKHDLFPTVTDADRLTVSYGSSIEGTTNDFPFQKFLSQIASRD